MVGPHPDLNYAADDLRIAFRANAERFTTIQFKPHRLIAGESDAVTQMTQFRHQIRAHRNATSG